MNIVLNSVLEIMFALSHTSSTRRLPVWTTKNTSCSTPARRPPPLPTPPPRMGSADGLAVAVTMDMVGGSETTLKEPSERMPRALKRKSSFSSAASTDIWVTSYL